MMQAVLTQALNRAEELARPTFTARMIVWGWRQWTEHQQRRKYRKTVRTLAGLDDRTLHDIGLERSEITSYAARGSEDRHPADRFMPRYIPPTY